MNLIQENPNNNDNKVRSLKNSLIVIIAFAVILIIVAIVLYVYSLKVVTAQFKVVIDGTNKTALATSDSAFFIEDGKIYISIRDIAPEIKYTVYNGEYNKYTEDTSSCYATNQMETVDFKSGSNEIRKYPRSADSESQLFELDEPITERGNKLYISVDGMRKAFNTVVEYTESNNTVTLTTLPYLTTLYEKSVKDAYLTNKNNYEKLSEDIIFNNQKALLSNLVVVVDEDTKLYGVAKYENNEENLVITKRYKSIEYIEGMNDFIVKTDQGKYGIIGSEGITKINPEYDNIQEVDKNQGLYLVTSNRKQGIINQNGKTIVYQDYEQIGLDPDNGDSNVKNRFLLYDNCIPVRQNGFWGIIDINGKTIVEPQFDGIGCKMSSKEVNTGGIVLIPDLEWIIVEKDEKTSNSTVKKYGAIDKEGKKTTNIIADSAYSTTIENKTTYYMLVNNEAKDIVKLFYDKQEDDANRQNQQNDAENANEENDDFNVTQESTSINNNNNNNNKQNIQTIEKQTNQQSEQSTKQNNLTQNKASTNKAN